MSFLPQEKNDYHKVKKANFVIYMNVYYMLYKTCNHILKTDNVIYPKPWKHTLEVDELSGS